MITLPRFELLFSVRSDKGDQWRGLVRGCPDIFVKLLREDVSANLPFDALADFETISHISKAL